MTHNRPVCPHGRLFFLVQARTPRLGWEGTRRWANADRDLRVGARYESGGHVELTWTLKPWRGQYGDWSASVVTWLDAGAAKDTFVGALWQFLTADGDPVDYYESDEYFE